MVDRKNEEGRPRKRGYVASAIGGSGLTVLVLNKPDPVVKILNAAAALSHSQAEVVIGLFLVVALMYLLFKVIDHAVQRREDEVNSFRDVAAKWEGIINSDLREIKALVSKKGGK